MASVNKAILIGHIGEEPTLRYLSGDVAVLSFPLATNEYIFKDGNKIEQTEWHNIVMWRGLAESASKVLKKGKLLYLEGKIRTRSFVDKQNVKRYITEIIPDMFTLLGRRSDFEAEPSHELEEPALSNTNKRPV